MSFRDLVVAALDAGDVAPDSAAGRIALDLVLHAMSEADRGVRVVPWRSR